MKNSYILVINGSYRSDGMTDQILSVMTETLRQSGIEVKTVTLREKNIKYCLNCRSCSQLPGDKPDECVIDDDMKGIIEDILGASGYIFASPTNFFYATALYKCFLERLMPFGYWPWGAHGPKYRILNASKPAILISSSAMPSIFARVVTNTMPALRVTAKTVGAKPIGSLFAGLAATKRDAEISASVKKKAKALAGKLIEKV